VAQEVSAEVMVAEVGCGRKKKKVAEKRERLEGEEREGHGRCSTTSEELG
jgi:hypothetical protein